MELVQLSNSCEYILFTTYEELKRLNITEIPEDQIINFKNLAREQVKLAEIGSVPIDPQILKALDFALSLEV